MPDLHRTGTAIWTGSLRDGSGLASTGSGLVTDVPITFASRFESGAESSPEELIAAAHAACFSMALSGNLTKGGTIPETIVTEATVTLRRGEAGSQIVAVHLATRGRVPGADQDAFRSAAETAKANCPVSKLLAPGLETLTVDASLES